MASMRTCVYVDGFNLYYGCLRGTAYKWLNLVELCKALLPQNEILTIKYCTAQVSALPHDPGAPMRQQMYFRALKTLPEVKIILGHFLSHDVRMPLARPQGGRTHEYVTKREEKGSDVNLAVHLVADAFQDKYDVGVLVTNDSDLKEAARVVKSVIGKKVGVLNPHQRRASRALSNEADFVKTIRPSVLPGCQFPDELTDKVGVFRKPADW